MILSRIWFGIVCLSICVISAKSTEEENDEVIVDVPQQQQQQDLDSEAQDTEIDSSSESMDKQPLLEGGENVTNAKDDVVVKPVHKRVSCVAQFNYSNNNHVQVVNGSSLIQMLSEQYNSSVANRSVAANCSLVLFYAPWCTFSASAAPHYNALSRLFSDIHMLAVDSSQHSSVNTQFGVVALPTIILFHNSKPVNKFNQSTYDTEHFVRFVTMLTGLSASGPSEVMPEDYDGPIPCEPVVETDVTLYMAWIFVLLCGLGYFGTSSFCERIVETVRNNWREAEIQHEHNE